MSTGQLWSFNLTTIAAGKARQQVLVDKKEDAKTSFSVAHGDFDGDNIKGWHSICHHCRRFCFIVVQTATAITLSCTQP